MDFAFSEEQELLRSSARDFLRDRSAPERVAELADSDAGWDPATWKQITELGWVGLSVPEDRGGSGMSLLDEAVLFEETGRALYPGPFLSTVVLAQPALGASADGFSAVLEAGGAATLAWVEPGGVSSLAELDGVKTEARASGDEWKLTGEKVLVPDLALTSNVVVVARSADGLGLWLVSRPDDFKTQGTVDGTRRFGRFELDGDPGTLLVGSDEVGDVLEQIRLRSLAALALEAVGVAQFALDSAAAYVKERKQFDKPIGTYQAVSHQVADIYVDTELARSLAYWAAWCVAEGDRQASTAALAAKAFAADAAVKACERSIQVHGGIGFTYEHTLHRYYRRAQWIQSFDGSGRVHRAAVAAALLDA
ncbi:MAG: acyl-CoA dehydrogenase [Actinobacteria bacterium]|nr:acyl-CoA dehydrogenase [Actinomycetota bacterium]